MMRMLGIVFFMILNLLVLPVSANPPAGEADARAFFDRYIELGEAYDADLANLYSDEAVIKASRQYPDGSRRTMQLSGSQWKSLIEKVMPLAKAQEDRSTYSNIEVEIRADQAKISADRYSERKCYRDTGYYMIIERQASGDYRIVEEYSETQPQSNC